MAISDDIESDGTPIAVPEQHEKYFMREMVERKKDIKRFLEFNIKYASCGLSEIESTFNHMINNNVVAGGALVELIQPDTDIYNQTGLDVEPINDIDIFILDTDQSKRAAERFLHLLDVQKMSINHKITDIRTRQFSDTYRNLNHILGIVDIPVRNILTNPHFVANAFQLIFTTHKTGKDLVETFDLRHSKVRLEQGKMVVLSEQTFQDIKNKRLVRVNPGKKISPIRLDKFRK